MKVVILGGKGNLGSQLNQVFVDDHEVYSFDKDDFDVLDSSYLAKVLEEIKPNLVINTVAYNQVDACEDPKEYVKALSLNRDLPATLGMLAIELNFVLAHYSTDYVFSGLKSRPSFSEDETPNPINKYGESKFLGELELKRLESKGLNYYLIRTSKLFGPKTENTLAKPSFFDIMLKLAENRKELMAVNEELSCFTYTSDLAAASARLLIARPLVGVYHLVNEGPATWYDGASELFKLAKKEIFLRKVRSEDLARLARRPKFSVLENNKLKKMRPYQEALKDYLRIIL
jgi:dTDP-4-dehydrorhamnose reductase